jgi:uncharacterized protein
MHYVPSHQKDRIDPYQNTKTDIMNLLQESHGEGYQIRRYSPTEILIGERPLQRSLLLAPDQIDAEWGPNHADALTRDHIEQIIALSPELVLLGTGSRRAIFSTPEQQRWLQLFPGMEIMDTGAACRTYNLLLSEGRRVVAGLIIETNLT